MSKKYVPKLGGFGPFELDEEAFVLMQDRRGTWREMTPYESDRVLKLLEERLQQTS